MEIQNLVLEGCKIPAFNSNGIVLITRFCMAPFTPFKPDGSLRMCVDSRPGNRCTESMKITLLNMAEMVQSWRGAKYFCTMDAAQGYFQAPLSPCSYKYSDLLT